MKSKDQVDLRTPYTSTMFKRNSKEQIQLRLKIVRHAQQHGIKPAARHFGTSKNTVKKWMTAFQESGTSGLANKSRAPHTCPHKTSQEVEERIIEKRKIMPCYGPKTLKYFNPSITVSEAAIYRILKEKGLIRRNKKKYQKKNDLRKIKAEYASLTHHQEDVKHLYDISNYWEQMHSLKLPKYEYTIRDVKTGFTVVAFADSYSEQYSEMLTELYLRHLKAFDIDLSQVEVQTDNGSEFGAKKRNINTPGFVNTIVKELGAQHNYIPPGCSNANGDVESFHATIEKEFFDLENFSSKEHFFHKAQVYQSFYNFARPNFSKGGKPPLQILLESSPHIDPKVLNFPVYDLDAVFRQKTENIGGQYVQKLPGTLFS
jgi:transposase